MPADLQDDLDIAISRLRQVGTDLQGIEVKTASRRLPVSTVDSVSAFANAAGGLLILGVSETDGFKAVDLNAPKIAAELASLCSDQLEPPVRAWIDIATLDEKPVVIARIPELDPAQKPCHVKTRGLNRGSYVRTHDGDRQLTSYEVHVLASARRQPKEDMAIVPDATINDLDRERVRSLVNRMRSTRVRVFRDTSDEDILRRMGVITGREADAGVTLAGLIALGIYPQQFLPQLFVSFTASPTLTGEAMADNTRFLDNQSLDGSVPDIIEDALRAMRRNMKRRAIVTGAGREDRWDYPEAAIRELITNALMHRDYHPSAVGTQVRLTLYPDRFEVTSPGGLYGPVSRDALLTDHITSSRNTHLSKLFEDVLMPDTERTVCENRGTGLLEVASSLRRAGMAPPEIHDNIRQFRVVVRAEVLLDEPARAWLSSIGADALNEHQRFALGYLFHYRQITQPRYRDVTGCDDATATGDLALLCSKGFIKAADNRGGTVWGLMEYSSIRDHPNRVREDPIPYAINRPQRRQDRRASIRQALSKEDMSTAELSELIGVGQPAILRWLRRMEDDAEVEPTEPDRRSRHNRWRLIGGG